MESQDIQWEDKQLYLQALEHTDARRKGGNRSEF